NPATQRNVATLREYGYLIVEPEVGSLASGLTGIGRLAEPGTIADAVERLFERAGDLEGLRVVVSAGGTREPIDPVRFIGKQSSGRKIKRDGAELQVDLVPNPDIIAEVGEMPAEVRPFLIGFAAESQDLEANAIGKLRDKGLDLIVGNVVGGPFDAIGSDENK